MGIKRYIRTFILASNWQENNELGGDWLSVSSISICTFEAYLGMHLPRTVYTTQLMMKGSKT
jgi:hypothetical protein